MSLEEKETFFMSESLKGRVEPSQFYNDLKEGEGISSFYFLDQKAPVNVNVDNLELDNEKNRITISFECNPRVAGKMIDEKLKRIDIDFGGYLVSRKIAKLASSKITFPTRDLCFAVLSFDFVHHI